MEQSGSFIKVPGWDKKAIDACRLFGITIRHFGKQNRMPPEFGKAPKMPKPPVGKLPSGWTSRCEQDPYYQHWTTTVYNSEEDPVIATTAKGPNDWPDTFTLIAPHGTALFRQLEQEEKDWQELDEALALELELEHF